MKVIDGKQIAADICMELQPEVTALTKRGVTLGLSVILVGENSASESYVNAKKKACKEIGIRSEDCRLPETTTQKELMDLIKQMNVNPEISGILIQLPLPRHMDSQEILCAIDPNKDVDGFHPVNVGRMVIGKEALLPCTPHGIVQLLIRSGVETTGAHVTVIGRSNIVGKPIANMLIQKRKGGNATVTLCHTCTKDMKFYTRKADIVIVAAGRPNTLTLDMIKKNAVVIDVGVNHVSDTSYKRGYRLIGDVDFDALKRKVSMITPVPGGVGPMTIAMLLSNTVKAAKWQNAIDESDFVTD